ncbi:MAG: AraC family transcriptional regulator [Ruminococcaceae bacterium]|nr:AraC family transcriptional regulator [Oscillospiraceae bacterium]
MRNVYYKHKVENLINISKIVTVHYFEFDPHFRTRGESHDFWELVYAVRNPVLCTANGERILLEEGEVLFHKPNEFHTLAADGAHPPDVFIISFECKSEAIRFFENRHLKLDRELRKYVYSIIDESKNTFDLPVSSPDVRKMPLAKSDSLGGLQLIKNLTEILLIQLMRTETGKVDTAAQFLLKEDYEGHITREIIAFLKANVHNTVTVDDVAANLSYTKSYLFRQFKKATGDTIMSYFLKLKIDAAKKMLREGKTSVSDIAASLAFDSPNYFSKAFKKVTGRTPLQYKSMHSKN